MTRRSGRHQRKSENVHKGKVNKQCNRKKVQPLAKLQCEKNELVLEDVVKPCILSESTEKKAEADHVGADLISGESLAPPSPLLHERWGSSDVCLNMVFREQNYSHSKNFLQRHPTLQPNMRSILLDWLIEVSEEYSLHRQTFYLAQDYFDRFMLTQNNIEKSMLQLIGITCLFIAAKMEEARPLLVSQMSYITASTFYEDEILRMELIILKALRWKLCPETAVSWLKLYFQMASMNSSSELLEQQFSKEVYVQITRVLDLCILDINSLDFEYRVLAASVLCNFIQQETVERVSGLSNSAVQTCVNWTTPFVEALSQSKNVTLKDFGRVKTEDRHNIQTHTDYLSMLDAAGKNQSTVELLTPPSSTEKPSHTDLQEDD